MKGNPYVGPRPYERGEHNFYGRKREARNLRAMIVSEQVALFYAQSGAGKTSLLNAQVIPALEEMRFNVLPVARVGNELPPEINPQAVKNIFVFSALMGLAGPETPPETLLDHTLRSFLELLSSEDKDDSRPRPPLLIFDQLEELFTRHRGRWQDAKGFFRQVQESLDAVPRLGVVFTLREDRVAEIDPYTPLFPDRLRARFRMERLGPEGALEAVTKPASNAGCPFDPGAAEKLVDNLRQIKVQRRAGAEEETVLGQFVEPVQLQVVCNRLWENLPEQEDAALSADRPQRRAIQWEEVEEYGNVDRALTDFYEDAVHRVVERTNVHEDRLRDWFERQLITEGGTRAALYRGKDTGGLPNEAADLLVDAHVLRTETRAGGRWVELVHDRLVNPIIQANAAWRQAHPLIRAALEWREAGKPASKLYQGEQLATAFGNPDARMELVRTFLDAGKQAQERQERGRRRTILALVGSVLILTLLLWTAVVQWRRAKGELDLLRNRDNLQKQIDQYSSIPGTSDYVVPALAVDTDAAWISLQNGKSQEGVGLLYYHPQSNKYRHYKAKDGLKGTWVTALWAEGDEVWFGVEDVGVLHGLVSADDVKFTLIRSFNSRVLSIVRDTQGNLWIGTALEGLHRESPGDWQVVTDVQTLCPHLESSEFSFRVERMALDRVNNVLWLATLSDGLIRWPVGEETGTQDCYRIADIMENRPGLFSNSLTALTIDAEGRPIVGTEEGFVGHFIEGAETSRREDDRWRIAHVAYSKVQALAALGEGSFLASALETSQISFYYAPTEEWIDVQLSKGLHTVYDIVSGPNNHLWYGTNQGTYRTDTPVSP